MKHITVIGIGAGNLEYITVQTVNALNRADVIFLLDKASQEGWTNRLRRGIGKRYTSHRRYRMVEFLGSDRGLDDGDYRRAVDQLNADKQRPSNG